MLRGLVYDNIGIVCTIGDEVRDVALRKELEMQEVAVQDYLNTVILLTLKNIMTLCMIQGLLLREPAKRSEFSLYKT